MFVSLFEPEEGERIAVDDALDYLVRYFGSGVPATWSLSRRILSMPSFNF